MKIQGRMIVGLLFLAALSVSAQLAHAEGVQWLTDAPAALQQSRASGRPVLMRFSAEWCGPCRKMERTTFADPATAQAIHQSFVPLLIDVEENEKIAQKLSIRGLPTLLVVAPDMTILARIKGFQTSERLMPQLNQAIAAFRQTSGVPAQPVAQQRPAPLSQEPNRLTTGQGTAESRMPTYPGTAVVRKKTNHPRQLPSEPSFEGYCLTSVIDQRQLIKGTPEFESTYRGQKLYFRDDDQRDLFFDNPDKYWPALDGQCPLTMLDSGQSAPGKLKYAAVYRDQIWLLSDREKLERFIESPSEFVDQVLDRLQSASAPRQSF